MTTKIKLSTNVADVDVTTTAPTAGQALIWDATNSKWIPGSVAAGADVDGGFANSVYTAAQSIDGGTASG